VTGLHEQNVDCPYCGEPITLLVDGSVEQSSYTEDCAVCCQPMLVQILASFDGVLERVQVLREDDTG
jgi:hypothetical protein